MILINYKFFGTNEKICNNKDEMILMMMITLMMNNIICIYFIYLFICSEYKYFNY